MNVVDLVEAMVVRSVRAYDKDRKSYDGDADLIVDLLGTAEGPAKRKAGPFPTTVDALVDVALRLQLKVLLEEIKNALRSRHGDWKRKDVEAFAQSTQTWLLREVFPSLSSSAQQEDCEKPPPKRRRLGL